MSKDILDPARKDGLIDLFVVCVFGRTFLNWRSSLYNLLKPVEPLRAPICVQPTIGASLERSNKRSTLS